MRARPSSVVLVAALVAAPLLALPTAPAAAASGPPAGFVRTERPTGVSSLTSFELLPDGALLAAGKNGDVTWLSPDDSTRVPLTIRPSATTPPAPRIGVLNTGDVGLVDIELAHDFATTRGVYTVYAYGTKEQPFHRLSRWTLVEDDNGRSVELAGEQKVLDAIPATKPVHGATDVHVQPDGVLWLATGDMSDHIGPQQTSFRALSLDQPQGKLLRIRPDGRGVASNPFYDAARPTSWRSRVYASGFRSPFRFTIDPTTGTPVVGDVGWYSFEEINTVKPGASYGWPCWEGPNPAPEHQNDPKCQGVGHAAPAFSYPRNVGTSVTGGVVYTGDSYPSQYRGAYFFADYTNKRISVARFRADGTLAAPVASFADDMGGPVEFETAPNGDLLYANIFNGRVVRLSYSTGNTAPTPRFSTSTDRAQKTVTFDAAATTDQEGDDLTYAWTFSDGSPGQSGVAVTRPYADGTAFDVTLTVTDTAGKKAVLKRAVRPDNHAPVLTVEPPTGSMPDGTFKVGDTVRLTAAVTDVEDDAESLTAQIRWDVDRYHCRGTVCHSHPGEHGEGPEFQTVFDDHGGETSFVVRASVTDSAGAETITVVQADPALRRLEVRTTSPAQVSLNGYPATEAMVAVGSSNTVGLAASAVDGSVFGSWSDGSTARNRTVVMPDRALSLAATYRSPIVLRYERDAQARALLGRPVGVEQTDGGARWQVYQGGRMYWSAATGPRVIYGAILESYLAAGGHPRLGAPSTDELGTPDGRGRFNHFAAAASVYWTPATGANAVYGAIRATWAATGWERGPLGYPATSELGTPDGVGRFNHFSNGGSVYWTPNTGAQAVHGAIRSTWAASGWENGPLGYPVTSETGTPDRVGRFNHFSKGGSVYWSPSTGAHPVHGAIRDRWAALGWEQGYLGYPTSGEFAFSGGRRSNFRGGYITWTPRTGAVDRR